MSSRSKRNPDEEEEEDDHHPEDLDEDPEDIDEIQPPDSGFSNAIVIDNLPLVPPSKYSKLENVINKIFSNIGPIHDDGLYMPTDPHTQMTKGFAFLEYLDSKTTHQAVEKLNGLKLDKSHILSVSLFEEMTKFKQVPDEYVAPQPKEYEEKENLYWWLANKQFLNCDQFVIKQGDETEVYWHLPKNPTLIISKKQWTDSYLAWSPLGTYLVTFHKPGIILWGGESWVKIKRFQHALVKAIDFSPKENYLVTAATDSLIIWEVRTGKKLKSIPAESEDWPVFKWSFDDKYVAKITPGQSISVWETPSMTLVDKKSIKIPQVKSFCWSPTQHFISCWVPEQEGGNNPAKVMLIEIPSKREVRQKNLFSVVDCTMFWQNRGDYLCVKVDRLTKTRKSKYTNFEIFFMKEKQIPIEVLERQQNIIHFAWEPHGNRFALIHSNELTTNFPKTDISFYSLEGTSLKLLKTLEKRPANQLFWSPRGDYIVLSGLRNYNGALEFYNVNDLETMAVQEHHAAKHLIWDPSGRYVATFASTWEQVSFLSSENGYCIWSFHGKLLQKVNKEKFYELVWRPRPPSLLNAEKIQEIKKNLKNYSKKYSQEESKKKGELKKERQIRREKLKKSFEEYLAKKKAEFELEEDERKKLFGRTLSHKDELADFEIREFEQVVESYIEYI